MVLVQHHPVCAFRGGFAVLLDRAATPKQQFLERGPFAAFLKGWFHNYPTWRLSVSTFEVSPD
jgi:hypothetical protein